MVKLDSLLEAEGFKLYKTQVIIKNKTAVNQFDIFNQIRALPDVVVVTPIRNELLKRKSNKDVEYALFNMKYLVHKAPNLAMNKIKELAMKGGPEVRSVHGLLTFEPLMKTTKQ